MAYFVVDAATQLVEVLPGSGGAAAVVVAALVAGESALELGVGGTATAVPTRVPLRCRGGELTRLVEVRLAGGGGLAIALQPAGASLLTESSSPPSPLVLTARLMASGRAICTGSVVVDAAATTATTRATIRLVDVVGAPVAALALAVRVAPVPVSLVPHLVQCQAVQRAVVEALSADAAASAAPAALLRGTMEAMSHAGNAVAAQLLQGRGGVAAEASATSPPRPSEARPTPTPLRGVTLPRQSSPVVPGSGGGFAFTPPPLAYAAPGGVVPHRIAGTPTTVRFERGAPDGGALVLCDEWTLSVVKALAARGGGARSRATGTSSGSGNTANAAPFARPASFATAVLRGLEEDGDEAGRVAPPAASPARSITRMDALSASPGRSRSRSPEASAPAERAEAAWSHLGVVPPPQDVWRALPRTCDWLYATMAGRRSVAPHITTAAAGKAVQAATRLRFSPTRRPPGSPASPPAAAAPVPAVGLPPPPPPVEAADAGSRLSRALRAKLAAAAEQRRSRGHVAAPVVTGASVATQVAAAGPAAGPLTAPRPSRGAAPVDIVEPPHLRRQHVGSHPDATGAGSTLPGHGDSFVATAAAAVNIARVSPRAFDHLTVPPSAAPTVDALETSLSVTDAEIHAALLHSGVTVVTDGDMTGGSGGATAASPLSPRRAGGDALAAHAGMRILGEVTHDERE